MPITTKCPGCQSLFRLSNDLAGAQVRCEKCAQLFVVPTASEPAVEAPAPMVEAPEQPPEEIVLAEPTEGKPKPPPLPKPFVPAERPASAMGALALVLLFLTGVLGIGAFATTWTAIHLLPPIRVTLVPPLHATREAFDGRRKDFEKDMNVKFKDKNFEPFVGNRIAPQRIIAWLDEQGTYSETREFTPKDPTRVGLGSYKEYLISLERGKRYRVQVSLKDSAASVEVFDPNNFLVTNDANKKGVNVTFTPQLTGVYRINVMAVLPKDREAYTLHIATQP